MEAGRSAAGRHAALAWLALALAGTFFGVVLFKHLSYPLLWHDEAETAVFAERVLEHGYPVVRSGQNVVYSLWQRGGVGVDEATGAYTGSAWGQYYVGALGVVLAGESRDLYARTRWLRAPFALAGFLGALLLGAGVLPALGPGSLRRPLFAALFLLLLGYSVSLILHLREARHCGLTLLLTAGALVVFVRRHVFGALSAGAYTALLALLLFLLFNTFHPAFTVLLLALGLELALRALRAPGTPRERAAELARAALPLAIAAVCALPLLAFFDFLAQTRGWVERFGGAASYSGNLRHLGSTLLRYEFLAPALVLRGTAFLLRRRAAELARHPALRQRLELAELLFRFIAIYVFFIALTPFLFERYFIVLSPLLTLMLLLDAFSVADLLRLAPASPRVRAAGRAGVALAAACLGAGLFVRAPDFAGRLYELRHPYRGPLDFVIPYLAAKYPHPERLVIATNYEGPAYMFYLGSHVTVGYYGADLEHDRTLQPDVIVPRPWPDQLEVLRELARGARYQTTRFPVRNLWWNNVPALGSRGERGTGHRFRTPPARDGVPALEILERKPAPAP